MSNALYIKRDFYTVYDNDYTVKTTLYEDGKVRIEVISNKEVPVELAVTTNDSTKEFALRLKK